MSNPNTPTRDTVSPTSSGMDSTFYSINDSGKMRVTHTHSPNRI